MRENKQKQKTDTSLAHDRHPPAKKSYWPRYLKGKIYTPTWLTTLSGTLRYVENVHKNVRGPRGSAHVCAQE